MSADLTQHLWTPYFLLLLVGFLPSEVWRWLSAFLSHGVDEDSEIFLFVRSVAIALLVGVVIRLIISPVGGLNATFLSARLGAIGAAVASFFIFRRSVFAAICVGELAIILSTYFYSPNAAGF